MEAVIRKFGIQKTFFIITTIFGVLGVTSMLATVYLINLEDSSGRQINIAGRQRMLTQKMTKESFRLANDSSQGESLSKTVKLFDESLNALSIGSSAMGVEAATDKKILNQLNLVKQKWEPFKQNIEKILVNSGNTKALNFIASNNLDLLSESNTVVSLMEKKSHGIFDLIKIIMYASGLGIILMILMLLYACRVVGGLLQEASEQFTKMAQAQKWIGRKYHKSLMSLKDTVVGQSSATQQTAATMEQMSAMNKMTADRLKKCSEKTNASISMASQAESNSLEMKSTMEELVGAQNELTTLGDMVASIGEQTNIINDIAFKTQLLSFNASIEAARAGAQGRGFSVVASEVGNLANTSADSARNIESSIGDSVKRVREFIDGLGESIKSTSGHSDELTNQIKDLAGDISNLDIEYTEMHSAISENRTSIQQTIEATRKLAHGIDQINNEVTALAEESGRLKKVSDRLDQVTEIIEELSKGAA